MESTLKVPQGAERVTMLGLGDRNLKILREALGVKVSAREDAVQISGEPQAVAAARAVLDHLGSAAVRSEHLSRQRVVDLIGLAMAGNLGAPADAAPGQRKSPVRSANPGPYAPVDDAAPDCGPPWQDHLDVYANQRPIRAKTVNQQRYLDAIRDHDMVFGLGPAGTGKTYLAVAAAVHLLRAERTRKIILVRPAVEAGERLGFLPGDLQDKVNPYLRPLLDALHDMMDFATMKRFMFNDVVEVVPLAYMRGRTLNNATIILDEAQNSTRGQMQMFLTRLGHGSKMIITGDTSQIDLPDPTESGLVDAARRLGRVRGIAFCTLTQADIVRHNLVQRIVEAYGPSPVQMHPALPFTGEHESLFPRGDDSEAGGQK